MEVEDSIDRTTSHYTGTVMVGVVCSCLLTALTDRHNSNFENSIVVPHNLCGLKFKYFITPRAQKMVGPKE